MVQPNKIIVELSIQVVNHDHQNPASGRFSKSQIAALNLSLQIESLWLILN